MGLMLTLLFLYFLPTIIAAIRGCRNGVSIMIVNLFLGWTLLFWVVTLAWACGDSGK